MHDAGAIASEVAPSFGVTPTDLLDLFKLDGVPEPASRASEIAGPGLALLTKMAGKTVTTG